MKPINFTKNGCPCMKSNNEYLCRTPFSVKQSLSVSLQTNLALKIGSSFTDDLETQLTPVSSFTSWDIMRAQ